MEKLKALLEKLKLFWKGKAVPFFKELKGYWDKAVEILTSNVFVYTFPLAVFALLAFVLQSILMVIVCFIWLVPVIYNANEKNE